MTAKSKKPTSSKAQQRQMLEVNAHLFELAGFGEDVVKIVDAHTGENICYIGMVNDAEKIYFAKPVCFDVMSSIYELMKKKKLRKALNKGKIEKAQSLADKKFAKS